MSPSETPGSRSAAHPQFLHRPALAFDLLGRSRHFHHPPPSDSRGGVHFGAKLRFACATTCRLARPLSEQTKLLPSLRGLLHQGFRRIGHPHRRRISLQWQLGKFHWRDSLALHPL